MPSEFDKRVTKSVCESNDLAMLIAVLDMAASTTASPYRSSSEYPFDIRFTRSACSTSSEIYLHRALADNK